MFNLSITRDIVIPYWPWLLFFAGTALVNSVFINRRKARDAEAEARQFGPPLPPFVPPLPEHEWWNEPRGTNLVGWRD